VIVKILSLLKFLMDNIDTIKDLIQMISDLWGKDPQTFTAGNYPAINDACFQTGENIEDLKDYILSKKKADE